jgi:hypothetical protein
MHCKRLFALGIVALCLTWQTAAQDEAPAADAGPAWLTRVNSAAESGGKEAAAASAAALQSSAFQTAADEVHKGVKALDVAIAASQGVKEAVGAKAQATAAAAAATADLAAAVSRGEAAEAQTVREEAMKALSEAENAAEAAQAKRFGARHVTEKQLTKSHAAISKALQLTQHYADTAAAAAAAGAVTNSAAAAEKATADISDAADSQEWPWEHANTLGAPPSFVHLDEAVAQEHEGLVDAEKSFKLTRQALMEQGVKVEDIDNGWVARTEAATDAGGKEAQAASASALESAALQAAADEAQLSMGALERAVDAMNGVQEAVKAKAAAIVEASKETAKLAAIVPHEDVEGEAQELRQAAMEALEAADKASEDAQITRTAAFRVAEKQMNIANAAREKVGVLEEKALTAGDSAEAAHEVARDASNAETVTDDLTQNTGEWPWEHEDTLGAPPALVDESRINLRGALSALLDMGTFKSPKQQQEMYEAQANALHDYDAQAWTINSWHGEKEDGADGDENLDISEDGTIDDRKRRSILAARAAAYATKAASAVVKEAKFAQLGLTESEKAAEAEKKATSALALAAVKAQEKAQLHAEAVATAAQLASALSNDDVKEANSLRGDAANEAKQAEEASKDAVEAERYASQVATLQNKKAIEAEESARKAAEEELQASRISQIAEEHATQAAEDEARMAENFDDDHESAKHSFAQVVTYDCGAPLGTMTCVHADYCCLKYNINCVKHIACEASRSQSFLSLTGGEDSMLQDCFIPTTQLMPLAAEHCCSQYGIACDKVPFAMLEAGTFKSAKQQQQVRDAAKGSSAAHDSASWTINSNAVKADADDTRERRAKYAARAATFEAAAASAAATEAHMSDVAVEQTQRAKEAEVTAEQALLSAAQKTKEVANLHADAVEAHAKLAAAVQDGDKDAANESRQEIAQKTKLANEETADALEAEKYAASVAVAQAAKAREYEKKATLAVEKGQLASEEGHRAADQASQAAHDEQAEEAVFPEGSF